MPDQNTAEDRGNESYADHSSAPFWKTLGMSMLANFFDIRKDSKRLFKICIFHLMLRSVKMAESMANNFPDA